MVKNPPANAGGREIWAQSLGWEDPLEKQLATHSSILAWGIPWTEEPGGLQSMGWQRDRHDLSDLACTHICCALLGAEESEEVQGCAGPLNRPSPLKAPIKSKALRGAPGGGDRQRTVRGPGAAPGGWDTAATLPTCEPGRRNRKSALLQERPVYITLFTYSCIFGRAGPSLLCVGSL